VRLKSGDPFLYGRGGEEIIAVRKALARSDSGGSVKVHVVAGVTSAFAAPLVAGIPVTHRGLADQVKT
jgi:uroporphyrin-III C-methyltransferase / precorrin-2 dehydrogenase / sirohydrochlorin ferrochelatase